MGRESKELSISFKTLIVTSTTAECPKTKGTMVVEDSSSSLGKETVQVKMMREASTQTKVLNKQMKATMESLWKRIIFWSSLPRRQTREERKRRERRK